MKQNNIKKRAYSETEAAHYIGMSVSYLQKSRRGKTKTLGPAFYKLGRMIRYLKEELDAWLDHNAKEGADKSKEGNS